MVPEDIGKQAAYRLLEEVQRGGVCDSMHQVSPIPFPRSAAPEQFIDQELWTLQGERFLLDRI